MTNNCYIFTFVSRVSAFLVQVKSRSNKLVLSTDLTVLSKHCLLPLAFLVFLNPTLATLFLMLWLTSQSLHSLPLIHSLVFLLHFWGILPLLFFFVASNNFHGCSIASPFLIFELFCARKAIL